MGQLPISKRKTGGARNPAPPADPPHRTWQLLTESLREANQALGDRLQRLEAALDNMSQGLCMFDDEACLVVCNRRYREIFGLEAEEVVLGMSQEELVRLLVAKGTYSPSVTLERVLDATRQALARGDGAPFSRELADGRLLSILYRALEGGGWVSTFEDVTERRRYEERIAHLSDHDALTDLASSRVLRENTHAVLGNVPDAAPMLAVVHLDLDRFKSVNESFGHAAGDELLRAVAERLRGGVRRGDVVARLGGDEFAILRRVHDETAALRFAHRVRLSVARPYDLDVGRIEIGASIGIALREGVVEDVEPLLQEADLALRCAKAAGRNEVRLFEAGMSESARQRRTIEAELQLAVARGEFELHYQPLVEIETKRIVGAEALIRWRHPEKGLVAPATFIPIAEETGLIVPIGNWVVRQACADATRWPSHIVVAVNVSSFQMREKGFARLVLETLSITDLPPERLELELTESALLDDGETTARNLARLREAGVRFAMDDFGTGYSSLSYLRRFPIDKIKIDRSFMQDAETSADARAIIRAVAGLGSSLGMTTVVEGVETENQLDLARGEGVDLMQGYLVSRPAPEAQFARLIREDEA